MPIDPINHNHSLTLSSNPSWLTSFFSLVAIYLLYLVSASIIRSKREHQTAYSIRQQRRRAGIPDQDKRPFNIAKAALIPSQNQLHPRLPSPNLKLDSHQSSLTRPELHPHRVNNHASPSRTSPAHRPTNDSHSFPKNHAPPSGSSINKSVSTHSGSPLKQSTHAIQRERSNQKRVASTCIDAEDVDEAGSETAKSAARNHKKAKTRSNDLSSKRSSAHQAGLAHKKPKASSSADHSAPQPPPSDHNHNRRDPIQAERVNKKRILSECSSELDADHALPTKKGRSDQPGTTPNDDQPDPNQDLMQVDDDEDGEAEGEGEGQDRSDGEQSSGEEPKSDEDVYMIASNGEKKKLVKIRPNSPELDELQDENTLEQRWVTRTEFRLLKQRGMLHLPNTRWDNSSRASTDTANSTLDSPPLSTRTPSKQAPSLETEHGPIWNIESKPGSRTTLSASKVPSQQLHSATRPRNSLGRMRLSLPPDMTSPIPRARSQLSLLGNHRQPGGSNQESARHLSQPASALSNSITINSSSKSSQLPNGLAKSASTAGNLFNHDKS